MKLTEDEKRALRDEWMPANDKIKALESVTKKIKKEKT